MGRLAVLLEAYFILKGHVNGAITGQERALNVVKHDCLAAYFIFFIPGSCLIAITVKNDPSLALIQRKNQFTMALGGLFLVLGAFIFGVVFTQNIQNVI